MQFGVSALWQAVGGAAGYLALLLFVAAPLRRFGTYTLPDFAESRLDSARLRKLAVAAVLGIAGFYLMPQLKGAGIAVNEITGAPYWVGITVVGAIVALNVALGGMRGVTYVQAYQFWVKLFTFAVPAILMLVYLGGLPDRGTLIGDELPHAPASGLAVTLDHPQTVEFPGATPFVDDGQKRRARAGEELALQPGRIILPPGAAIPVASGTTAQTGTDWARPIAHRGEASPCSSTRCCSRPSWGRWDYPTSWCASTPTRPGSPPGAPRSWSWRCCPLSICFPRCMAPSAGSWPLRST